MDNIEKLKEKLEKDPTSRLFVPLSEEYRKAGMLDEAIDVLLEGIENHPNYMSARSALGKAYLDKGRLTEAQQEFERVIAAIPDNIFAQRKLADVLYQRGLLEEAIEQYHRFFKLNPMDEEAQRIAQEIKSQIEEKRKATASAEEVKQPQSASEDVGFAHAVSESDEAYFESEMVGAMRLDDEVQDLSGEPVKGLEAVNAEDVFGVEVAEHGEIVQKGVEEGTVKPETVKEDLEVLPEASEKGALSEQTAIMEDEVRKEVHDALAAYGIGGPDEFADLGESSVETEIQVANELIKQEDYVGAIKRLRPILAEEPENVDVMQRLQELRSLLKLIGRDSEIVIANLELFLESFKKRKDELYRSA